MLSLKLKWDASGGKIIHEGALVLVGFMWSLSVLTWLFSLLSNWKLYKIINNKWKGVEENFWDVILIWVLIKDKSNCQG